MNSDISIVIPAKNPSSLVSTLESIRRSSLPPLEVVVVDASDPPLTLPAVLSNKYPTRLITRKSTQLEAQAVGTRAASGSRVLFVDADQSLSTDLLLELSFKPEPAVMMRELSPGRTLLSRLMTRNSDYLIRFSEHHPSNLGLAIPRFFARSDLLRVFYRLEALVFSTGVWRDAHPDSVLFALWASTNNLDISKAVGIARNPIYHTAPTLGDLYKKTYAYGKKRAYFLREYQKLRSQDSDSIPEIIANANLRRVYFDRQVGINYSGLLLDCLKLPAYLAGSISPGRG
jgi:glycosyltransferase involved in cell wall biosynthesis